MSASAVPVNQEDDGPEEGEIEDDEDDLTLPGAVRSSSSPQHPGSTTSTSHDIYPSATRKDSYERDIRHFEVRRGRTIRARRSSGASKSMASVHSLEAHTRTKHKHPRTGSTQGKENRHVYRHKSPVHRHHKGSQDKTLIDCREVSPLRRDSSLSSVDSDDRPAVERGSHHRTSRKCSRLDKTKRKSSSSPETYIPVRHRTHHSAKCPLIKILHSVAKETRKVMDSENQTESSTLRQRLLNMGVMSAGTEEDQPPREKNVATHKAGCDSTEGTSSSQKPTNSENSLSEAQKDNVQTEIPAVVVKQEPDVVTLSDSDQEIDNGPEASVTLTPLEDTGEKSELVSVSSPAPEGVAEDDDEDDIGRLRLLALQSKKNEPPPPEDADVLQLRLAALKTALIKKFQSRKKTAIKINIKSTFDDPLSPLDEIPVPFSPTSPDEVMTPVDMELAETDDEAASVHSINCYSPSDPIPDCYSPSDPVPVDLYPECYSPSDPTGSPTLVPSIQDLLPPPPPPDILYLSDPNLQSSEEVIAYYADSGKRIDILSPPPLPPYFKELLSDCDYPGEILEEGADIPSVDQAITVGTQDAPSPVLCSKAQDDEVSVIIIEDVETPDDPIDNVPVNVPLQKSTALPEKLPGNNPSENETPSQLPLAKVIPKQPQMNYSETLFTQKAETKSICLEEEEKQLRQRLLLNMAMKRGLSQKKDMASITKVSQGKLPVPSQVKKAQINTNGKVNGSVVQQTRQSITPIESTTRLKTLSPQLLTNQSTDGKRFIINLGEDSDSNDDYTEAEALGRKCAENRGNWILYLKKFEDTVSPGIKAGKLSNTVNVKVPPALREKIGKKPLMENLADLESSVEKFLKGVRSSHESSSKVNTGSSSVSSHATPLAVKHLPVSQQEEYRRLKQQIAKLEKQRQIAVKVQKQNSVTASKGSQTITTARAQNVKQVLKNSNPLISSSISSKTSTNSITNVLAPQVSSVPAPKHEVNAIQSSSKNSDARIGREISVNRSNTALANVSNLNVTSVIPKTSVSEVVSTEFITGSLEGTEVVQDQHVLKNLESNLIKERSHVLCQVSALAKLLVHVDKSLEAQSETATEVSSLIDKLCLAAGRWKAQNRTVTGLVERVAQRQMDLSTSHRRFISVSKSCAELGNQLQGKNYRVPIDKADAMRVQVKQVHEKTQELARRRTAEQSRKYTLERRAEVCLVKLFSDSKTSSTVKPINGRTKDQVPAVPSEAKTLKESGNSQRLHPQGQGVDKLNSAVIPPTKVPDSNNSIATKSTAVTSSPQLSSVISRAVTCRLALNKVRSAKATLNSASRKRFCEKRGRPSAKRICSKTRLRIEDCNDDLSDMDISSNEIKIKGSPNRRVANEDFRHDLSDMDISTDGEDVERRMKDTENTEVVDMSVSPDTSPSGNEKDSSDRNERFRTKKNLKRGNSLKELVLSEGAILKVNCSEDSGSSVVHRPSHSGKAATNQLKSQKSCHPIGLRAEVPHAAPESVLKKYISPLGGLNVFSENVRNRVKVKTQEDDLNAILCPYDLNGKCQDSECLYKHQHN